MKLPGKKGLLTRKAFQIIIILVLFICLALIANQIWGNPISKQIAKSTCLNYYQEKYHQDFAILEVEYWPKLPGYVLTLNPQSDPQIQFECNPNCEPICNTDAYAGKLASILIVEQVAQIIKSEYKELNLTISASEDPLTVYGGELPDYFESDPAIRLTKNHQDMNITWVDPSIKRDEFDHITEDMAGLINSQLPDNNPNLQVTISVYADASPKGVRFETHFHLFPTMNFQE